MVNSTTVSGTILSSFDWLSSGIFIFLVMFLVLTVISLIVLRRYARLNQSSSMLFWIVGVVICVIVSLSVSFSASYLVFILKFLSDL